MAAYGRKTACKLFCKAGGQGCQARQIANCKLQIALQNAESMVKWD
jgi:hypothetical protein